MIHTFSKGSCHVASISVRLSSLLSHKAYQLKKNALCTENLTGKYLCVDKSSSGEKLGINQGANIGSAQKSISIVRKEQY